MKVVLATAFTGNYSSKAREYLLSIEAHSDFDQNIAILFGEGDFSPVLDLHLDAKITLEHLSSKSVQHYNQNGCIQHGDFIESPSIQALDDEDVIVFTDSDIILQRRMNQYEDKLLYNLGDRHFVAGANWSPVESLLHEITKMGGCHDQSFEQNYFGHNWTYMQVYNVGVCAARKSTWREMRDLYVMHYQRALPAIHHQARQQWLMSYLMQICYFTVTMMPLTMHTHGHRDNRRPVPYGDHTWEDGALKVHGEKVMFRHAI